MHAIFQSQRAIVTFGNDFERYSCLLGTYIVTRSPDGNTKEDFRVFYETLRGQLIDTAANKGFIAMMANAMQLCYSCIEAKSKFPLQY
jgi:hypothetical protein